MQVLEKKSLGLFGVQGLPVDPCNPLAKGGLPCNLEVTEVGGLRIMASRMSGQGSAVAARDAWRVRLGRGSQF